MSVTRYGKRSEVQLVIGDNVKGRTDAYQPAGRAQVVRLASLRADGKCQLANLM